MALATVGFETARRASEVLLALAVLQQALEHVITQPRDRPWALVQLPLAVAMAFGWWPSLVQGGLLLVSVLWVAHLQGPYNGGSDRMRLLLLSCLWASHLGPVAVAPADDLETVIARWPRMAMGYLAVQVVLSYTLAGYVKVMNRDWRRGQALADVFAFSVYPVSDGLRRWADARRALWWLSWLTIVFEILFPLALLRPGLLYLALAAALGFHLVNAAVFGLNRFVWSWLATYPILVWFQGELAAALR